MARHRGSAEARDRTETRHRTLLPRKPSHSILQPPHCIPRSCAPLPPTQSAATGSSGSACRAFFSSTSDARTAARAIARCAAQPTQLCSAATWSAARRAPASALAAPLALAGALAVEPTEPPPGAPSAGAPSPGALSVRSSRGKPVSSPRAALTRRMRHTASLMRVRGISPRSTAACNRSTCACSVTRRHQGRSQARQTRSIGPGHIRGWHIGEVDWARAYQGMAYRGG